MKAHTTEKQEILLSIGMIVKNEEKVLERCLKSLQPLMNAIPSELIIADTGSTDSTVEIAKRYTDNVFHFEWINDFAAARNSTLKKAKGQWYMFIDADEYLDDDIGEIVHFFNIPELRSKYKTIEIITRSYSNREKTEYLDSCLVRFQRIDDSEDKVEFIGKVHEGIPIRYPLGYFSTILHHTGYCYSSKEQINKKMNRNLELMRTEYENSSNKDLRLLSHIIDGAFFNENEREKYVSEALTIARENRKHFYSNVVFMQAIAFYQETKPEYSISICDEYYTSSDDPDKYLATVAVMYLKCKILSALSKYEESYEAFKKYESLYNDYKEDKLIITDSSAHPIQGLSYSEYIRCNCVAAMDLKMIKRYNEAFSLLDKFDLDNLEGENFRTILGSIRDICQTSKQYGAMTLTFEKIMNLSDANKRLLALYMMESTYYSIVGEDKRMDFAKKVVDSSEQHLLYSELMALLINQDKDNFNTELYGFINKVDDWKEGYSEAIYLAVKHGLDIGDVIDRINTSEFRPKLEIIANNHDDFAGYVLDYGVPDSYTANIKRFLWITSLYEKASYRSFSLDDNSKYNLYIKFTNLLGEYVNNIYNPELLQDESDVEVISPLHRFGYYMLKANNELMEGNSVEYIRKMKKALVNCESMKEIVEFLLEQFKKMMGLE